MEKLDTLFTVKVDEDYENNDKEPVTKWIIIVVVILGLLLIIKNLI